MRPEHDARRAIIREWMALPKEKRQTKEHAAIFAKKAVESHPIRSLLAADLNLSDGSGDKVGA
jgi:hypothetical protein